MTNPNHNAFTTPLPENREYPDPADYEGLTKREYFAAMAMQGICANSTTDIEPHVYGIAKIALECADALIKALNETK